MNSALSHAEPAERSWLRWGAALIALAVAGAAFFQQPLALAVPLAVIYALVLVYDWRAVYWALVFFIPFSIDLSYLGLPLSTSLPDEPMMMAFVPVTAALLLSRREALPRWWARHPLMLLLGLQFVWLIVAVIFSKEPLLSVKFLAAKVWFLTSFLVLPVWLFREKRHFVLAFRLFLCALAFTACIILYRHSRVYFDFMRIHEAIGVLYYNRVEYSTVLSMFYGLMCAALPLTPRGSVQRWVLIGLLALFLPAIYFTFARAAILALVFMFGMNLAVRWRKAPVAILAFYLLVGSTVAWLIRDNKYYDLRPDFNKTYTHTTLSDHLIATFKGEDMSSMERFYRWIACARMSQERPWTGYGPNAFYFYYKRHAVTAFRTWVSRNDERSTTHNYFLFMLVEQGWPAMLLYAILVVAFFHHAQKVYHRFKGRDRFYAHVTMGLVMMFAAGFINNFFSEMIETHKVGALFYLSIVLLVVLDRKSREVVDVSSD